MEAFLHALHAWKTVTYLQLPWEEQAPAAHPLPMASPFLAAATAGPRWPPLPHGLAWPGLDQSFFLLRPHQLTDPGGQGGLFLTFPK